MDPNHPFYQKLQQSKNILLVKDQVGKAKVCVRDLPNQNHSYGAKPKPDKEGAGALLSSWQEHQPTRKEATQKDFKLLNKMSLDNKLTSAKEVTNFVKENDVKVKEKKGKAHKEHEIVSNEEFFGVPNKPGTPIGEIVMFGYGNKAAEDIRKTYQEQLADKGLKSM